MTSEPFRCSHCQTYAPFKLKTGMRFISLFFVVPVIPISGKKQLIECPNCGTKYNIE